MREAEALEKIEKERARARQGERKDLKSNIPEIFPESARLDRGETRDKVAKATGIGSGKTYDTAKQNKRLVPVYYTGTG